MRTMLALVGLALTAAVPATVTPDDWLAARMDRVVEVAGLERGAVRTMLVANGSLDIDGTGAVVRVPRTLIAQAPSAQAVDGILAMLLSYRQSVASARRGVSVGEAAALAGLVAATGGISEDKSTKVIPLGGSGRESRDITGSSARREKAQRGARWAEAAGSCTAELTGYLQVLAQSSVSDAQALTARRILTDLGALASPSTQACPARNDDDFTAVRTLLTTTS